MTNKIRLVAIFILSALYISGYGQENWKLKTQKEGIAIYMRALPDSKFKAIKVDCELETTLSQLVAVLLDVNTGAEWVYSTKSSVLLKKVSPSELYYYSEVSIPWPASNRDFIARLKVVQDTHTRVVTVFGPTFPNYLPVKKDIVRVQKSEGRWVLTPTGKGRVRVEYTLHADPGGDIPAWLVNMFATKGPLESFKKLKEVLKKPEYANAHFDFMTD
jgi:hypothetical protein